MACGRTGVMEAQSQHLEFTAVGESGEEKRKRERERERESEERREGRSEGGE